MISTALIVSGVFGQLSAPSRHRPSSDLIEKWREIEREREREGETEETESIEMCLETAFVIQSTALSGPRGQV